jgi:hypothetical protein
MATRLKAAPSNVLSLISWHSRELPAESTGNDEYDVRVGIEWTGAEPLQILTIDSSHFVYEGVSTPLHRFAPVETSVDGRESDSEFHRHVYDLARDCVNQGGISYLQLIGPPD